MRCCWDNSPLWQSSSAKQKKRSECKNHNPGCKSNMCGLVSSWNSYSTWGSDQRNNSLNSAKVMSENWFSATAEGYETWLKIYVGMMPKIVWKKVPYLWMNDFLHCVSQLSSCSQWISGVFCRNPPSRTLCCAAHEEIDLLQHIYNHFILMQTLFAFVYWE